MLPYLCTTFATPTPHSTASHSSLPFPPPSRWHLPARSSHSMLAAQLWSRRRGPYWDWRQRPPAPSSLPLPLSPSPSFPGWFPLDPGARARGRYRCWPCAAVSAGPAGPGPGGRNQNTWWWWHAYEKALFPECSAGIQQEIRDLSMNYPWIIHELSINYPWIIHEFIHELSMNYPWIYPWLIHEFIHDLSMNYPCLIHDLSKTYPRLIQDLSTYPCILD